MWFYGRPLSPLCSRLIQELKLLWPYLGHSELSRCNIKSCKLHDFPEGLKLHSFDLILRAAETTILQKMKRKQNKKTRKQYLSWMHWTKRRAANDVLNLIGLNLIKRQNPVVFGLTDSFVRKHAVWAEVFHTIEAARRGLGTILTVCTFGGILDS